VNSRATIELPIFVGGFVGRSVISAAQTKWEPRLPTDYAYGNSLPPNTPSAQADSSEVARHFSGRV
jgi:hypothetical protein